MPGKVLVFELCSELEQELIRQQLSEDTLKRYRKVLNEFSVFGGEKIYHQSLGTKFLIELTTLNVSVFWLSIITLESFIPELIFTVSSFGLKDFVRVRRGILRVL